MNHRPDPVPDVPPLPVDPHLLADAVTGSWDGSRLRLADAVDALSPPRSPAGPAPTPAPARSSGVVRPGTRPLDPETVDLYVQRMRDLQRRAADSGHVIRLDDDYPS